MHRPDAAASDAAAAAVRGEEGARAPQRPSRAPAAPDGRPAAVYAASGLLTLLVTALYLRLWQLDWSLPFFPAGGAQLSIVETTLDQGWYHGPDPTSVSSSTDFVAPFDHPLHLLSIRLLGVVVTDPAVLLNLLFLLGFPAAALTATAFLRKVGLTPWPTVALATLFALTPFHFLQGQASLPVAGYWPVPLGLCVVLAVLRRERLWTVPTTGSAARAVLTGPAARTTVALVLVGLSGSDFAAFVLLLLIAAAVAGWARSTPRPHGLRGLGAAAAAVAVLLAVRLLWSTTVVRPTVDQPWGDVSANSFKFIALVLPSPGHPFSRLADLRAGYDTDFWYQSGHAALGVVAAVGMLVLLMNPLVRAMGPRGPWPRRLDDQSRTTLAELSGLTWVAFLFGAFGGLAVVDGLVRNITGEVHTWHRISVFLALFGLAAVGLWIDSSVQWWHRLADRPARPDRQRNPSRNRDLAGQLPMILAVLVFLIGAVDQQIDAAHPATPAGIAQADAR